MKAQAKRRTTASVLTPHVRPPQQERSRASFDRVLDAAVELLEEEGYRGLTLRAVSSRAKTSIGSLYCRVKSKEDLIRVVQMHVLAKLDAEAASFTNMAQWKAIGLSSLVPYLIRELGEFIRRHAAILRALQARSIDDPVIAAKGEESFWRMAEYFRRVLLLRKSEMNHPNPEHASRVCFDVSYACIQKFLGIGIRPDTSIGEGNWHQLLDDLALLCTSYLQIDSLISVGDQAKTEVRVNGAIAEARVPARKAKRKK